MLSIKKILHPTDYSDPSRPAFDLACSLARDFDAELIVCHVSPPTITAVDEGIVVEIPSEEAEQMEARLEQMKPEDPRLRVSYRLLRGDPAGEIVRLASDAKADLIVMGTLGRSGFGRLLMGSVAESVMSKATCPVVTVKAASPAERLEIPTKKPVTA